ncbi:MAG: hypothetical protein RIR44_1145 [Bacteroidota bacterium]|jgi:hypothetical protein
MNSAPKVIVLFILLLSCSYNNYAQNNTDIQERKKIILFLPLEIDAVFNGNEYILGNKNLPKTMLPGLDFYNGVIMALDSIKKINSALDIRIIDAKQKNNPLTTLLTDSSLQKPALIISAITSRTDTKLIADFALTQQTQMVSAIFPNDAGVTNNPFFTVLNPTLKTQCEAIYNYIQTNFSKNSILYLKKKGTTEDYIQNIIQGGNSKTTQPFLNIDVPDSIAFADIVPYLDSTKQNILLCGSLKENFGYSIVKMLNDNPAYKATIIGMPTWDGEKSLNVPNVEIIYASPYYFNSNEKLLRQLTGAYKQKYLGRPSDQFFKGYETMLYFINSLLFQTSPAFNTFKIMPVYNADSKSQVDYLENKNLYFFRKQNGQIKSAKPNSY